MTVRRGTRFKFLVEGPADSPGLAELQALLVLRPVRYRLAKVPRSNRVRLLVSKLDYDVAFRVFLEWSAAHKGSDVEGSASALRSPAAGEQGHQPGPGPVLVR